MKDPRNLEDRELLERLHTAREFAKLYGDLYGNTEELKVVDAEVRRRPGLIGKSYKEGEQR